MSAPKNPNVERAARVPFDKDAVSPMPQYAPRQRADGAGPGSETASAPLPDTGAARPHAQEEYPGPQTATSGKRVEPGRERTNSEKGA
jgi:hypothetical protein